MFRCQYVIDNMQPVIRDLKGNQDNKLDKENDIMTPFVMDTVHN